MSSVLRLYTEDEAGPDGYPRAWHETIKHLVRIEDGHRCLRCKHPYIVGDHKMEIEGYSDSGAPIYVSWSACDELCSHDGPIRRLGVHVEARARILTVHHLDRVKLNCRWWNLVSLCQRCHLHIQKKVDMLRVFPFEHTDWFKPYAAGWYAFTYLGLELERDEAEARLDELLALERIV